LRSHVALFLVALAVGCGHKKDSTAVPPAPFNLTASGTIPPNSAISSLTIFSDHAAIGLMNSFGAPFEERILPFDPLSGALGVSVTARQSLTFSPPLTSSGGNPVATTTTSGPAFAATVASKLYVTTNNFTANFDYNPGTVLVYDYDVTHNTVGAYRGPIVTTGTGLTFYNPTAILPFTRSGGTPRLAVVCASDNNNPQQAAVVVIDPATDTIAESVTLGATAAGFGEAALGADLKLYVGSAVNSELYIVDLANQPPTLDHGAANPVAVSTTSAFTNNIADLEMSRDGRSLYVLNSNDGALSVFSVATSPADPLFVTRTAAFKRTSPPTSTSYPYENSPLTLAVRPGRPGIDFSGPDLVVGTAFIRTQDQVLTGVKSAVDTVTSYTSPMTVSLNAVVSPFTVHADIQQIVAGPNGWFYVVEAETGRIIVRDFGSLR
jgi:hypothetical protein